MKIGSLVICPNGHQSHDPRFVIPASEDIIYEVLDIKEIKGMFGIQIIERNRCIVLFPEGLCELWYHIEAFREVQPPIDLTEIIKSQNLTLV